MDNHAAINWVAEVVALASDVVGQPVDSETQGEIELVVGKSILGRGEIEQAAQLFALATHHITNDARKSELAGQLLLLGKIWGKRKDTPPDDVAIERAFRAAVALDPVQALPAFAHYLQRQNRFPEAISCWREALRVNPKEGNLYLRLAQLYEQAGRSEDALATYVELMNSAPSARNYLLVGQRLDQLAPALAEVRTRTVKIALLGNATLDHLQSYLKVECYRAGLRPDIYQSGFDQYTQEILNAQSGLYAFSPEVVICAIHASRLFPRIHHYPFDLTLDERRLEIDAGLGRLQTLLDSVTDHSSALVLVHAMVAPQYPALGLQDWRHDFGQAEMFGEINVRLARMVRSRYKNVFLVDEERIQARVGKAGATDPRLWLIAGMAWSHSVLMELTQEYLRYIKANASMSRKCIVLDLDNTLWGGVIGEDGIGGIQLGPDAPGNSFVAFQRELERLWRRGILLAIASKNNEDDALPVFEHHGNMVLKLSHFAAHRINWNSKADSVREIAQELNIGLDSLVFLDDNPVERACIRAELPQVMTPELPTDPAYFRYALLDLDVFETLTLTEEDRRRNTFYAEQNARREFENVHESDTGSLEAYLAALEMVVEIEPVNENTLPRIAQLTNKTNQFNLTTRRYSEAQINELAAAGHQIYGMRVSDRFGDNGLVGAAIVAPKSAGSWDIDTLLLSCRVMGRGVETALLAYLEGRARESGIRWIQGWYLPTAKNSPVKECYPQHGFELLEHRPDGSELWQLDLTDSPMTVPPWLTFRSGVPDRSPDRQ